MYNVVILTSSDSDSDFSDESGGLSRFHLASPVCKV